MHPFLRVTSVTERVFMRRIFATAFSQLLEWRVWNVCKLYLFFWSILDLTVKARREFDALVSCLKWAAFSVTLCYCLFFSASLVIVISFEAMCELMCICSIRFYFIYTSLQYAVEIIHWFWPWTVFGTCRSLGYPCWTVDKNWGFLSVEILKSWLTWVWNCPFDSKTLKLSTLSGYESLQISNYFLIDWLIDGLNFIVH